MPPRSTRAATGSTWLHRSFVFYGSYHNNPVNQLIHIVFVWAILYSSFVMLRWTPALSNAQLPLPTAIKSILPQGTTFPLNAQALVAGLYFLWYAAVEPDGFAGYICCALVAAGYVGANVVVQLYGDDAFKWSRALHILSWVSQFIGHGAFEGRSPALLQNFFQAFAMAPLFVVMEVMFAVGYRPDFRARAQVDIDKQIKQWAADKKKST